MKLFKRIISLLVVLWLIGAVGALFEPETSQYTPEPQKAAVIEQKPIPKQVLPTIKELGIDKSNLPEILIVDTFSGICLGATACYTQDYQGNGYMEFTADVATNPERHSAVAHEYLHHIHASLSSQESEYVDQEIKQAYEKRQRLFDVRMEWYYERGCEDICKTKELHAVMCTEVPDAYLTKYLVTHCNQHIPNRDIIPNYF